MSGTIEGHVLSDVEQAPLVIFENGTDMNQQLHVDAPLGIDWARLHNATHSLGFHGADLGPLESEHPMQIQIWSYLSISKERHQRNAQRMISSDKSQRSIIGFRGTALVQ